MKINKKLKKRKRKCGLPASLPMGLAGRGRLSSRCLHLSAGSNEQAHAGLGLCGSSSLVLYPYLR